MIIKPSYGEIWLVALDPTIGREQAKTRPCLVVSDDRLNNSSAGLAFIVPITSQNKKIPWHIEITSPEGGLKKTSYIMCEHMKSLSHLRFRGNRLGIVQENTMAAIKARLRLLCDL